MQEPVDRAEPRLRRVTPLDEGAGPTPSPSDIPPRPGIVPRSGTDLVRLLGEHRDALAVLVMLTAGVTLVLLGWYGAANTNILSEQIPYLISGGLLGLGLIIVAGILAGSMRNAREARALRVHIARALASGGRATQDGAPAPVSGSVLLIPGGRSYHEPGCPIVEGKQISEVARAAATDAGYAPCKLCGLD